MTQNHLSSVINTIKHLSYISAILSHMVSACPYCHLAALPLSNSQRLGFLAPVPRKIELDFPLLTPVACSFPRAFCLVSYSFLGSHHSGDVPRAVYWGVHLGVDRDVDRGYWNPVAFSWADGLGVSLNFQPLQLNTRNLDIHAVRHPHHTKPTGRLFLMADCMTKDKSRLKRDFTR